MKRRLKIEEKGVRYNAAARCPMVRLKGKWLAAAGFPAGSQVEIKVYAPGCMDLRVIRVDRNILGESCMAAVVALDRVDGGGK
jgi:hypothetical protein